VPLPASAIQLGENGAIHSEQRAVGVMASALGPSELVDTYFGLEEQLTGSLGTPVDLVMETARRNPIVQADIDATKQLLYAA